MRLSIRDYQTRDRPLLVAGLNSMLDHLARIDPWGRTVRQPNHGVEAASAVLRRVKQRHGFILVAKVEDLPVAIAVAWLSRIPG